MDLRAVCLVRAISSDDSLELMRIRLSRNSYLPPSFRFSKLLMDDDGDDGGELVVVDFSRGFREMIKKCKKIGSIFGGNFQR